MPSPFPGMDPYLEGSEWAGVHGQLIAEIGRQLAPRLRPRYVARMQKWFAVDSGRAEEAVSIDLNAPAELYPDVGIVEEGRGAAPSATIVAPAPLQMETVIPRLAPQQSLEIRDVANRQRVAAIEVLSSWNKRGDGYKQYVKRRTRFLCSTAHLVEIDLLRRGRRVPMRQALPAAPYFIFVSRAPNIPLRSRRSWTGFSCGMPTCAPKCCDTHCGLVVETSCKPVLCMIRVWLTKRFNWATRYRESNEDRQPIGATME